jgi:glycosyltransferase 2 family protein
LCRELPSGKCFLWVSLVTCVASIGEIAINLPAQTENQLGGEPALLRRLLPGLLALAVGGGVALAVVGVVSDRPHGHLAFRLGWLFPAIFALIALELMQAELWRGLLRSLGCRLDAPHSLAIWSVSAVARYVPTSMLMPIMRVRMSRARGVSSDVCIASVIYEGLLVNCGASVVAAYFIVRLSALRLDVWRWGIVLMPLAALAALHPRPFAFLSSKLLGRIGRPPLATHVSLRQLLGFTGGYVASFVLAGGGLVAVVMTVHPVGWEAVPTIVGAMAIGFIASTFAFVLPGGLGVREAALVVALSPVVSTLVASAAAVAVRVIQLGCELTAALVLSGLARRRERRVASD